MERERGKREKAGKIELWLRERKKHPERTESKRYILKVRAAEVLGVASDDELPNDNQVRIVIQRLCHLLDE